MENKLHFLQNLLALSAITLVVIVLSVDSYLYFKNSALKKQIVSTWKTYSNSEFGFSFMYPGNLSTDFTNHGFISGSDYIGSRDFNLLILDKNLEPSYVGFNNVASGKPSYDYNGYNFAIFSGVSALNQLKSYQDIIDKGQTYSPALQRQQVNVGSKKYDLFYLLPSNKPDSPKVSFWFISFPLPNSYTMIVSGNYDRNILVQILSTFKIKN